LLSEPGDEIRIVADRDQTDTYVHLLKAMNEDERFKDKKIKFFDYHPERRLDPSILKLTNLHLSVKTIGYANPNIEDDEDDFDQSGELNNMKIKKTSHSSSIPIVHIDLEKPKIDFSKSMNTFLKFVQTEITRNMFLSLTTDSFSQNNGAAPADAAQKLLSVLSVVAVQGSNLAIGAVNVLIGSLNTLVFPMKILFVGLAAIYLKYNKADEFLFEGHKLKNLDANIRMCILSPVLQNSVDFTEQALSQSHNAVLGHSAAPIILSYETPEEKMERADLFQEAILKEVQDLAGDELDQANELTERPSKRMKLE